MKTAAEVLYPAHNEGGTSTVGAWISGVGDATIRQAKKLQKLLPSNAGTRLVYRSGTLQMEVDIPGGQHDRISILKFARNIRSAILKSLGVKAGLCPVASSVQIRDVVRKH